ncbi:MAG: ABC transporter ATP-binding protein [Tepidanaerobacteraceae bacterium]|jgi:oligopeptide transport system ATP-binding protein|nr:ABC transporter ATP-binding protein [Tepidanaerobacteraceae bacterium]
MGRLLEVRDLKVNFKTYGGQVNAVRGVSFYLDEGECVAVVGESGCGKSVTSKAIMGLIPSPPGEITGGEIIFDNIDLLKLSKKGMMEIRGSKIGMIFQDPMTYLNPTMTIGKQIQEAIERHTKLNKRKAINRVIEMLNFVGMPNPEKRMRQYPHEFSGGMRQRVMIAMAMACNPRLLIADEPTTALDVTIQAQILDLMKSLQKKFDTSIMLITHDLGVVANMADRVLVFYAGKIVESGNVNDIFYYPQHPYTWGLLNSVPGLNLDKKGKLASIEGTPPDLFSPPDGCGFAARCAYAMKICKSIYPEMIDLGEGHQCACWLLHEKAQKIRQSLKSGGKSDGI